MTKKNIRLLVISNFLISVTLGSVYAYRFVEQRNRKEAKMREVGKKCASINLMTEDDFVRSCYMSGSVKDTHKISDDDLVWVFEAMKHPTVSYTGVNWWMSRNATLLSSWKYLTDTTPEQRDKIYQAACLYIPNSGSQHKALLSKDEKWIGQFLLGLSRDKRAIPLLQGLLQDPDSEIRERSSQMISQLKS